MSPKETHSKIPGEAGASPLRRGEGGGTIGILGGYGRVGEHIARELIRHAGYDLRIGGRNLKKGTELATTLGNRCSAHLVDVESKEMVSAFCRGCDVVVNASRNSEVLQEAVFEAGCHFVDTSEFDAEPWQSEESVLRERGASWITEAGWIPGVPEIVAAYIEAVARERLGADPEVSVYAYDCNDWSGAGFDEASSSILAREGTPVAPRMVEFPSPVGLRLASCYSDEGGSKLFLSADWLPEMAWSFWKSLEMSGAVFWYGKEQLSGWLADYVASPWMKSRTKFNGTSQSIVGSACAADEILECRLIETEHDGYWLAGAVPATVAHLLCEGVIEKRGISKLSEAMNPVVLAENLSDAGIDFLCR